MTLKEQLIQELDSVSEPLIVELLDFLHFLQAKHEQDDEDIRDARAALSTLNEEETVTWDELKTEVGL